MEGNLHNNLIYRGFLFRELVVGQVAIAVQLTELIIESKPEIPVIKLIIGVLTEIGGYGGGGILAEFAPRAKGSDRQRRPSFEEFLDHIESKISIAAGRPLQINIPALVVETDRSCQLMRETISGRCGRISLRPVIFIILRI